ncbi:MAG TPA: BlaI/MecI/CopY family transcriptional regulator [Tepidisphaeraceae bacterium]|nr:BlaI/MecI/CopY family transcriptional regulator [Tepidisphaeraceae bacterium]
MRRGLSKSELEIFQIVRKLGSAKVRQVVESLPADRDVDFFTVQTYLRRLKAKGYLRTQRQGRADVYSPAVKPQSVIRQITAEFVDRAFGGRPLTLMQHLIEDRGFTDTEIEELQAMLDESKRRRKS